MVSKGLEMKVKLVKSVQVNKLIRVTDGQVDQVLKLKGKTLVVVDWANIWGWQVGLTPEKIWNYFKNYKEVVGQNFYFGLDENDKSEAYLKEVTRLGFKLISKPVKYILGKRKCDFDLEIGLDCFENLDKFDSFIIMSGDGDFATLYERLLKKNKQVIVIFGKNHLGKENRLIKGLFLCEVGNIWQKISPDLRRGRDCKKFTTFKKKVNSNAKNNNYLVKKRSFDSPRGGVRSG